MIYERIKWNRDIKFIVYSSFYTRKKARTRYENIDIPRSIERQVLQIVLHSVIDTQNTPFVVTEQSSIAIRVSNHLVCDQLPVIIKSDLWLENVSVKNENAVLNVDLRLAVHLLFQAPPKKLAKMFKFTALNYRKYLSY